MTNTITEFPTLLLPVDPHFSFSADVFRAHAEVVGRLICAQRPMTRVVKDGQPVLRVAVRSWPKGADKAMGCQAALERGNVDRFVELMGVPESVQLTEDGRAIDRHAFCRCDEVDFTEHVYVEVWTVKGRVSHGWIHDACRRWTQTG
jgi:hypothetical protein